ncbi:MAG TPA: penicillin-binding protein 2 [Candidatus Saccharimonadales bacterium]|jgi:cell division protein FtsI/penicillin-binding protein 2|nr:penicillin-binding protein 2 [Candidatus Saccharimonadales bacterium]
MQPASLTSPNIAVKRVRICFAIVAVLLGIFMVRAFYLQVIKHEYYHKAALSDQLKQYEVPAPRGIIEAHNGEQVVPIVLNQKLFTVYADPTLIKDANKSAEMLAKELGGHSDDYLPKLKTKATSYVVLAKRIETDKRNSIMNHKYAGIGAQEMTYRTYPNGALASQLLGFVNNDGKGVYGVEQALNVSLSGKAGQLKAVTDINGVPLAANTENIQIASVPGKDVVLTIDMPMQQQLEAILQQGLKNAKSDSGSALIMEANTGAIKAMANWPTYDPTNYGSVEDGNVFNNATVSSPLEVGSVMKTLTTAAALDQGVIKADQTYNDPGSWKIDGFKITNIEEDGGAGTKSIADLLNLSLNTGATWELMQMSKPGGTEINSKGRQAWYSYMTDHFRLGKPTGIEQGYEDPGIIPHPDDGYARDLTYANTAFGQAMTATPLQMAAAFAASINGGTYYQPRLVDAYVTPDGNQTKVAPKVVRTNVVSPQVSNEMQDLLEYVVAKHYLVPPFNQQQYGVGGKTGTAQIEKDGKYLEHDFNGTYVGFVGGDQPQYVIFVRVNTPKIGGYAGAGAAQPIFGSLGHMLIDNFGVTPKGQ